MVLEAGQYIGQLQRIHAGAQIVLFSSPAKQSQWQPFTEIIMSFKKIKEFIEFSFNWLSGFNFIKKREANILKLKYLFFAHISAPLAAPSILPPATVVQLTPSTIPLSPEFIENPSLVETKRQR